jgi:hypothetical protein
MKGTKRFSSNVAGVTQAASVTFGNIFTIVPKASAIFVDFNRGHPTGNPSIGFVTRIGNITTTGADISVTSVFNYSSITISYVATQGDHLQVFFLETILTNPTISPIMIPFPYSNLQFDSNSPPAEVFVAIEIAGFQYTYPSSQQSIKLVPAQNPSGTWAAMTAPIAYSELHGTTKTFTTNDELVILDSSTMAHTTQFTLIVHRVNLAGETVDTGISTYRVTRTGINPTPFGYRNFNPSNAQYNNPTVGVGQVLLGLVGFNGFTVRETTTLAVPSLLSIKYTSVTSVTSESYGFSYGSSYFEDIVIGFYVENCDQSCETCYGVLSTQCATCTVGLNALSGACTCSDGKYVSSDATNFLCSDCDASCLTCSGSATNCVVCTGGLTPLDGGVCTCSDG